MGSVDLCSSALWQGDSPSLLLIGDITQAIRMSWLCGDRYCTGTPHKQTCFVNDKQFARLRPFHIKSASVLHRQMLPAAVWSFLVEAVLPGGIL